MMLDRRNEDRRRFKIRYIDSFGHKCTVRADNLERLAEQLKELHDRGVIFERLSIKLRIEIKTT